MVKFIWFLKITKIFYWSETLDSCQSVLAKCICFLLLNFVVASWILFKKKVTLINIEIDFKNVIEHIIRVQFVDLFFNEFHSAGLQELKFIFQWAL